MRKAIRDMLYSLEADTVIEADNGVNALNAMAKQHFDIVLCDYNLGEGKNGQQVLEEARYRKLLSYRSIFIIITAEQTASMVLGAMDSKPDEYLTKPFNAQQLYTRIERNFLRKRRLQSVEGEIQRGNLAQAIQNCDKLLEQDDKKIRAQLLKLRAELAINVGDFDGARAIYHDILEERDQPWAHLGLGIADFQQGNIEQAITIFEGLIADNPMFLESYDWLSKAYEAQNKLQDAQVVLNQAVDLSPQSILRQKKLAETADKNGDLGVAEKAYKAAVVLGKNSVYKSCSDFSNLAKVYSKNNSALEALKTLHAMRHEYVNSPEAELRATTLEAEVHKNLGNEALSQEAFEKSMAIAQQCGDKMPKDLQLDVVRSCFLHQQNEQAEALLETLVKTHVDDDQFMNDLRRMQTSIGLEDHAEALIQTTKRQLVAINNKGVALYKQGKLKEAIALFEQAIQAMPENKTMILNFLKILVHDLKNNPITPEKIIRTKALMDKAKKMGVDAHKLGILQMELAKLSSQQDSEGQA